MCWRSLVAYLMFAVAMGSPQSFAATKPQTVCTITVNSADEKDMFRRHLPAAKYRFVELVEPGRPDWLASACREQVSCDTLIISGHYDGGNEFFSDQLEAREFLPVAELERVSCSDSCPGLFSQLKEVYLFGCNTLNPSPQSSATVEVVRSLVREGRSPQQTERHLQASSAAHGESSLERMRQIFKDVPVIYGFSSVAPLGPVAASALGRYFAATGAREIGEGRANSRLLGQFAPFSLAMARHDRRDPHAAVRHDVCQFADDRLSEQPAGLHPPAAATAHGRRLDVHRPHPATGHRARRPCAADTRGGSRAGRDRTRHRRPCASSRPSEPGRAGRRAHTRAQCGARPGLALGR
ncbi:MAG: hypothetical protein IPP87_21710 [Ideonella sp.]|nr:hypothetical protein [Ideonella sp.]